MSTYEEFMVMLTMAMLIVSILNMKNKKIVALLWSSRRLF